MVMGLDLHLHSDPRLECFTDKEHLSEFCEATDPAGNLESNSSPGYKDCNPRSVAFYSDVWGCKIDLDEFPFCCEGSIQMSAPSVSCHKGLDLVLSVWTVPQGFVYVASRTS